MSDQKDLLEEMFKISINNKAYRLAMLEDYTELASKIENIKSEKVKERIDERASVISKEIKADLLNS